MTSKADPAKLSVLSLGVIQSARLGLVAQLGDRSVNVADHH